MQPSVVETVAVSYATHDRYGIVLDQGEYLPVTASDWTEFSLNMVQVTLAETAEIVRIKHNIAKIRDINALINSMEPERVKSDDDFAHKSDDIESEMDYEYVQDYDERFTSGFYDYKEGELEPITKLVDSFYDAVCSEVEDIDGSTYRTIIHPKHQFAHLQGIKALETIAERCELSYSYKQEYEDMPYDLKKKMPKR